MAIKKKSNKKAAKKTVAKRQPKNPLLPGMEDSAIMDLEVAAEDYAKVRDKRQALTAQEVSLQGELLALMHKHRKTEYHHDDVHCYLIAEKEKVRVKIGELPKEKPKTSRTEASEEDQEGFDPDSQGEEEVDQEEVTE